MLVFYVVAKNRALTALFYVLINVLTYFTPESKSVVPGVGSGENSQICVRFLMSY